MYFYAYKPHTLLSVMSMKRMMYRKHRVRRKTFSRSDPGLLLLLVSIASAYLIGCYFGARFGVRYTWSAEVVSILTDHAESSGSGLLSVLGSYGIYGLLFLLLSTTYLGFLFVPVVLLLKGFCTGALFLAFLQSGESNAYLLAGISLCLPELFVLPALILLGLTCGRLSFRLLRRTRGDLSAQAADRSDKALAVSFVLLLAGAFTETYVVPFLIDLASS